METRYVFSVEAAEFFNMQMNFRFENLKKEDFLSKLFLNLYVLIL
jgi:hypothetical protein